MQQRSIVERELVALHQQQQTHDGDDVDPSEQSATNTEKVTFNLAVASSRVLDIGLSKVSKEMVFCWPDTLLDAKPTVSELSYVSSASATTTVFYSPLSRTTRVSQYQKKHSPTDLSSSSNLYQPLPSTTIHSSFCFSFCFAQHV